jgi:hypothetical protein
MITSIFKTIDIRKEFDYTEIVELTQIFEKIMPPFFAVGLNANKKQNFKMKIQIK